MKHKIALLTDSGSDVPYHLVKELGIFVEIGRAHV